MNKKLLRFGIPGAIVVAVVIFLIARAGDPLKFLKPDPAFKDYITGYTSGVISVSSEVKIRLASPFADSLMIGKKADPALFSFSPSVDGEVYWVDSRTISFRPGSPMKPNTTYTCTFKLGSIKSVPEVFQEFVFQFHTIRQDYEVRLMAPETTSDQPEWYKVQGYVTTADRATLKQVQSMLEAIHEGAAKTIRWSEQAGSTRFNFSIDSIARGVQFTTLKVKHDGSPIGVKKRGEEELRISGTAEFSVLDARVVHDPEQCVLITFSDPLDPEMDFDGLVRIGSFRNLRFTTDGNLLRVYPNYSRSGEHTLIIESGIRNINGSTLGKLYSRTIDFESMKPAVRMVGEGSILPSTNGLLFPFEAVNLNAVDVQIQKIYERNVPQFLQVNELGGSNETYRVAATVYNQRVDLTQTSGNIADFGQWNRYALDLSKLMKPERGAIYRVILSFKQAYSTYPCGDSSPREESLTSLEPTEETEDEENWDYMGDYDYEWYGYDDYEYSDRNNPCTKSYYFYRSVSRNILSSDIGLIAKAGTDGELICFSTDIITALPLTGIEFQVLDYQMQTLATGTSDGDGKATFSLKKKPFLVIAKRGDERGYLKLSEGSTLSMSLFDVDGQTVRKGVKGFLYAERGVWRPGDTMMINFVLEDKLKQLPGDIPVMFELSDPQGNTIHRRVANTSVKGIYEFHTFTDESAITGNYLGKVMIGNLTFSRYFKVETVKPNRLKIELRFPNDRIEAAGEGVGMLEARWLHGALAPGLKADVSMTLEKGVTRFTGFEGYNFDDPTASFYTETSTVFEGVLDAAGKTKIETGIELEESAPGVLSASFSTKVFEPGGDFSINTITLPYYPYSSYAGLWVPKGTGWWDMLESGRQHQFKIANVTSAGKGISAKKLRVEVYKVDWRWWWQNSERGLPYFLSNTEATPVYTAEVAVSAGRGQFTWGGATDDWGRYLIKVTDTESGHSTGKVIYLDYSGWGRRQGQMREGAAMLTISTDKSKYYVGDKVNVTIPSSLEGRALVSIESGSKVLRTEWIKTDSGTTRFTFEANAEMSPNVYVHILMIQPHKQTINDMPIRMYGVVPVLVEDPNTYLQPVITMPATLEAESEVTITVSEAKGRPMAYTLAIVDEGLLDLTGFKTPDPWKHFYGKEALGVRTWDLFAEVIGAFAGGFERLLSIGGGDTRINHDKQKTRRFTPVVKHFGPMYLGAGKKQTHRFRMPQYVGSVRVMVVAAHEGAYGNAEKTVAVKSPLMVLGTLPRVAGPGETIDLPVTVFAMEKEIKNVQINIKPSGLFEALDVTTKTLTFRNTGDQVVNFKLRVKERTGNAAVDIVVTSGGRQARHTIRLEVRNPNPPQVVVLEKSIAPGETWSQPIDVHGLPGTNSAEIELSSIPPLNLSRRLNYLIRYPHGCLEQTVSAAFPQLLLKSLIHLDQRSSKEIDANIKAAITKLGSYMMSDGSLSYWPNSGYYNNWSNNYAGHFLIEAENRGFALPAGFKKRWVKAQKQLAGNWEANLNDRYGELMQAYRLYTLALAGEPDMGAMNRLRSSTRLLPQTKWRLAAAYALAGKTKTAQNLVDDASVNIAQYVEYGNNFGEPLRDKAMILEALLLLNDKARATDLAKGIIDALNSQSWYNTQTTAYSLIALAKYYALEKGNEGLKCSYQTNGNPIQVTSDKSIFTEKLPDIEKSSNRNLVVRNTSKGTLFVKVRVTGVPLPGNEVASNKKLTMKIEYLYPNGEKLDPVKIAQGKDFMARITISNTTLDRVEEIALTHIIPSGWQIHNARLNDIPDARMGQDAHFNFQDIRDDRILTYFNLEPGKSKTFTVMLNATYTGKYYLPAVRCEAMYVMDAFAQSAGRWVEVMR